MAYSIKLDLNNEIELPQHLDLQERIALCEEILEKYPEYFRYVMPKSARDNDVAGRNVTIRLDIMGSYILDAAEKDKEYPVLSDYKKKRIKNNEINISELEKYDKFSGK